MIEELWSQRSESIKAFLAIFAFVIFFILVFIYEMRKRRRERSNKKENPSFELTGESCDRGLFEDFSFDGTDLFPVYKATQSNVEWRSKDCLEVIETLEKDGVRAYCHGLHDVNKDGDTTFYVFVESEFVERAKRLIAEKL